MGINLIQDEGRVRSGLRPCRQLWAEIRLSEEENTATWARPPDWPADDERKAGESAVPWYGLFPQDWLDEWVKAEANGHNVPQLAAWNEGKRS